jgi:hypothetical protein
MSERVIAIRKRRPGRAARGLHSHQCVCHRRLVRAEWAALGLGGLKFILFGERQCLEIIERRDAIWVDTSVSPFRP